LIIQCLKYALIKERALASLDNDILALEDWFIKQLISFADVSSVTLTYGTLPKPDGESGQLRIPLLRLSKGINLDHYRKPADMFALADQVMFKSWNFNLGIFCT
jgi:hypothetical protein